MLFPQFHLLLPFLRTTVINYNTDDRGPGPSKFNFCQSIKMYNPAEIRVFIIKVATTGSHLTFLKT